MKLSKVNNINPDKRTFTPSNELLLSRRDVGIEIEAERYPGSREAPQHWVLTSDGSLRNNGIELVSSVIRGQDIIDALVNAATFCKDNKMVFSDRCSVHIHLDVRHLDTQELILLVSVYLLFEKFFFMQCGDPDREFNNHCRPIQSSMQLYAAIESLFSESRRDVARALESWPKYSAFNIKPIITQGSIEFRHHVGTCNKNDIVSWINLIFSLALYVRKHKEDNLQEIIDRVCLDGETLFNEVFPKYKGEFNDEIHLSMIEGARYIQVPIAAIGTKKPTSSKISILDGATMWDIESDVEERTREPTPPIQLRPQGVPRTATESEEQRGSIREAILRFRQQNITTGEDS